MLPPGGFVFPGRQHLSDRPGGSRRRGGGRRPGGAPAGGGLRVLAVGLGMMRWRAAPRPARVAAPQAPEDPMETRLRRAVEARPSDAAARRELASYYENYARPF